MQRELEVVKEKLQHVEEALQLTVTKVAAFEASRAEEAEAEVYREALAALPLAASRRHQSCP